MSTTSPLTSPAFRAEIARWARDAGVTWEVHTLSRAEQGRVRAVGHELQLTVRAPDLEPGCPDCLRVHQHVRDLADAAIAGTQGERLCHVRPFEHALRFRPSTGELQPEIEVAIEIERPPDAPGAMDEARLTTLLEKALGSLGVRKH